MLRQSSASIRNETLEYKLIHCTFDQNLLYFALSYTWGLQEPQETTIIVDGEIVPVSGNLRAALRSFCKPPGAASEEGSLRGVAHIRVRGPLCKAPPDDITG